MKLIILDRDGVINCDSENYIKNAKEWIPIKGSIEAISNLKKAGWTVAIATNQSGLARGYFDKVALNDMHQKMHSLLSNYDVKIDAIEYCPHLPTDQCNCRKPKPGMYINIATQFNCCLSNVPVVGDSLRDLEAAQQVGAIPYLVLTGKGQMTNAKGGLPTGTHIHKNLSSVVDELINKGN